MITLINIILVPVFFLGMLAMIGLRDWVWVFVCFVGLCVTTWPLPLVLLLVTLHGGF